LCAGLPPPEVGEGVLHAGDLAEPDLLAGFDEPVPGVGRQLFDPAELCRTDTNETASGAGMLVDAASAGG
jgi:hypothetical protein